MVSEALASSPSSVAASAEVLVAVVLAVSTERPRRMLPAVLRQTREAPCRVAGDDDLLTLVAGKLLH